MLLTPRGNRTTIAIYISKDLETFARKLAKKHSVSVSAVWESVMRDAQRRSKKKSRPSLAA